MNDGIIMYTTEDGATKVDLRIDIDTAWMLSSDIASLFDTSLPNISQHIKHIFEDGELDEDFVSKFMMIIGSDGKQYKRKAYNLDLILAVAYRVRSPRGIQFRNWASSILKEYIQKGFVLDDERLKDPTENDYYEQLLSRIRDIRTSEKRFYSKILEIFKTSVDYNLDSDETRKFFRLVQNKLHFAITGHTAPEIVYARANADQPNMGLTYTKSDYPRKSEIKVAKNYLVEREIQDLNQMTTAYLDIAEIRARDKRPMKMSDWARQVEQYIDLNEKPQLKGNGAISRNQANEKAENEFFKFKNGHEKVSQIEKDYIKYLNNAVDDLKNK